MKIKGKIVSAFHDITRCYSQLKVDINGKIYEIEIEDYPRKGNIYEIEELEIMLDGNIDEKSKKITDPKNIWIKLK